MHAADRNTNCVQHNKTHMDRRACGWANSRPHTHTMTENGARVSEPRHVNKIQDMSAGIRTPRSNMKQGTQTRERAARAHSHGTRTWREYQGSATKPWITLDRSDRTLTDCWEIKTCPIDMGVTTIYFEGDVSPPILEKYQSVPPNNRPIIL